ncbi:hypothetical protein RHGRI_006905 [Rhododendron griersonianum]|uniref:Peptidase A1 domain-containing protein n=1 Tax=Rhododendron griersonianum TaxID=479676 RepID=A0AAV6KVB2_9ERIC|nr:hypothetical protein RHGRI_006905 [Rhododendron griersonianum]
MASPFPSLLSLFTLLSLLTLPPSTTQTTITLSLSPPAKPPHTNPWQRLSHLASSSIARASQLKHPHKKNSSLTGIPLFPHAYGGYSVSLGFGTPPQTLSLLLDTGSSLVWVPCTTHYACTKCDFPNINPTNISTFIPKRSSSAKILGCKNPKCEWVFGAGIRSQCEDCAEGSGNCTRICPAYGIQYGSGSTSGILLSEALELPEKSVEDFLVGCSIFSTRQPSGIVGFGRGLESLPAQMGLKKFSYCLVSHRFDEEPESSDLILTTGFHSGVTKTEDLGFSYTPFVKNKLGNDSAFEEYYYVNLRKITVGGKHVRVPYDLLVQGSDGHGGTIVDSGTTFTFMEGKVYEAVAREFERQMAHYSRDAGVENQSGFRPCYNVSGGEEVVSLFPELVFHFKGGAKMELPLANYFSLVGESMAVCMTIVTDTGGDIAGGPSIVLGNYQQQDFYLEYDLENERLGFRKQTCK